MEGSLGSVRALGLVAIVVVTLLFCEVAKAQKPPSYECYNQCIEKYTCANSSPLCYLDCEAVCRLCNFVKSEGAVAINSKTIEGKSVVF
ncbi:hypothetical protein ACHQM5_025147 [Ranunculus cassubicifolius]